MVGGLAALISDVPGEGGGWGCIGQAGWKAKADSYNTRKMAGRYLGPAEETEKVRGQETQGLKKEGCSRSERSGRY